MKCKNSTYTGWVSSKQLRKFALSSDSLYLFAEYRKKQETKEINPKFATFLLALKKIKNKMWPGQYAVVSMKHCNRIQNYFFFSIKYKVRIETSRSSTVKIIDGSPEHDSPLWSKYLIWSCQVCVCIDVSKKLVSKKQLIFLKRAQPLLIYHLIFVPYTLRKTLLFAH